jgi:hypothetical protein
MRLLPRFFGVLCLIFLATQILYAQAEDESPKKTITVCRVELTGLGKAARFHFNYIYTLDVQSNGSVGEITKVREKEPPAFVREDEIIDCMRKWNLAPAGKYLVNFSVGTTSDPNSITIVAPNQESVLKLILP